MREGPGGMAHLETIEQPGTEWDRFVERWEGLLFHGSAWGRLVAQSFGGRCCYLALRDEGGRIALGMPGVIIPARLLNILYAQIPYGGVLGEEELLPAFLAQLVPAARAMGAHRIVINTPLPLCRLLPLTAPGIETLRAVGHLLDLTGLAPGEHFKQCPSSLRRNIRRARKNGVEVAAASGEDDVDRFYGLYLAAMARNRAAAKYPRSLFLDMYRSLVCAGCADLLLARYDGEAIAALFLVHSGAYTHYFHGGSLTEHLSLRPNDLLFHEAIEMAIARGQHYFDFMGSDPSDSNLIRYKEKWGARSVELTTYIYKISPVRNAIWDTAARWLGSGPGASISRWVRSASGGRPGSKE